LTITYRQYEITLTTESPFRIGRKRDPFTSIEQPIIVLGGRIVIPGTTLKGALREEMERYLIEKYSDRPGMKPCIPATPQTLTQDEYELIRRGIYKGPGCHYPCNVQRGTCKSVLCINNQIYLSKEEQGRGLHYICPVCYLLGAQGLPGFVIVPFLYAEAQPQELPALRMDRATKTVATGNYGTYRTYQVVPLGTKFTGTLKILLNDPIRNWKLGEPRNLKEHSLGDLWLQKNPEWKEPNKIINELILDRLRSISMLGGFKSHGAGKVKITVRSIGSG